MQKYILFLSLLSQLAHGGFSALASSIMWRINISWAGWACPSFNTVGTLYLRMITVIIIQNYRIDPYVLQTYPHNGHVILRSASLPCKHLAQKV